MSKWLRRVADDDNDTVLFNRLQEHALKNCPNPQRIGCPSLDTLKAFVHEPSEVSLDELHELHIMQCAECTRDLMELRRMREARRFESMSPGPKHRSLDFRYGVLIVGGCLLLAVGIAFWTFRAFRSDSTAGPEVVAATIDLSGAGRKRGVPDNDRSQTRVTLPRKKVQLRLILPYFSPAGQYMVVVTRDRDFGDGQASAHGDASASGAHTELHVLLDLRQLPRGDYYLSTSLAGDGEPCFYLLTLD